MSRVEFFEPVFVDLMPPMLEPGMLYISTEYHLTVHLCACGCGEKVVLPLHPKQWRFTYDGKTASISPSVGNIGLACNSHYWINEGRVDWAPDISAEKARAGHLRDRRDLSAASRPEIAPPPSRRSWLSRLLRPNRD